MRVALADLEAGAQGHLVERVGELTDPAGDRGDDAALADLSPGDEALGPRRAADLGPEAEGGACGELEAVELARGDPQVLDLALLEWPLARVLGGPQAAARLGEQRAAAQRVARAGRVAA